VRQIKTEQDAWDLLDLWVRGGAIPPISFQGWPVLQINIKGDDYQSSLNSGQMASLVELKRVFGRGYSVVAHGAYDMHRLKAEEDEALQFNTTVKKGSSILETDFTPLVKAFAQAVTAHPSLAVISATLIGLALVARPVILKFYETKAKQIEADERKGLLDLRLNTAETKQFKNFERALDKMVKTHPQFSQMLPDARDAFWKFASSSVNADTMTIAGLELARDDLEILSGRRAGQANDTKRVKGVFWVQSVTSRGDGYKVILRSQEKLINAHYRAPEMTEARIKRLTTRMVEKKPIRAMVDIKVVDKASLDGRLISFSAASQTSPEPVADKE